MPTQIQKILVPSLFCLFILTLTSLTGAAETDLSFLVPTEWLSGHIEDETLVVLHVGEKEETYKEGHIPGAIFARWDDFVVTRDGVPNELPETETLIDWVRSFGITKSSRIVLYDEDSGMRAARAFFTLDSIGLGDQLSILDGQLKGWKAEGHPLATGAPEAIPSNWNPGPDSPTRIIKKEELAELLALRGEGWTPKLLDSRSRKYFTGEERSGSAKRGGHLPGAIQFEWAEAIQEGDIPRLKPTSELTDLLEERGLNRDDPVITYCNTGRSASHLYFTLRHLGYDVRLYDGSMSEWTMDDENPVEVGTETESK